MTHLLLQKFNKVTASIKFKVTEHWNGILPTLPIYPLHVSYLMVKMVIIGFYYSEYIAQVQATSCKYILLRGRIQSVFGNRVISNGHQFLHCSSHGWLPERNFLVFKASDSRKSYSEESNRQSYYHYYIVRALTSFTKKRLLNESKQEGMVANLLLANIILTQRKLLNSLQ